MHQRSTFSSLALGGVVTLLVVAGSWAARPAAGAAEGGATSLDGQQVFLAQKCNLCHSVESAGIASKTQSEKMRGPDLTGVTTRREPDWIAKFVRKKVDIEGQLHKKEFTGTDEELNALTAWLAKQKK